MCIVSFKLIQWSWWVFLSLTKRVYEQIYICSYTLTVLNKKWWIIILELIVSVKRPVGIKPFGVWEAKQTGRKETTGTRKEGAARETEETGRAKEELSGKNKNKQKKANYLSTRKHFPTVIFSNYFIKKLIFLCRFPADPRWDWGSSHSQGSPWLARGGQTGSQRSTRRKRGHSSRGE